MKTSLSLIALLASLFAGPAGAVVIDSFTTNQALLSSPPGGASVATGGADIIGTRRALASNLATGAGPTTTGVAGGVLNLIVTNTTPDSRGDGLITWDGDATAANFNTTGLAPQNLRAANHSALRIRVNSATAGSELVFEVYSGAANASRGALRLPNVPAASEFFLSYKHDFATIAGTGADFGAVTALRMRVRGTEATVVIDVIETVGPTLTAGKRDLDLANSPIATPVLEGSTFKYRIDIANTGSTGTAEDVDLTDTVDANTTLDAASIRATPVAITDTYLTLGNVERSIATPGVLANDIDPDTTGAAPELIVAPASTGPQATALGGSINLAANGAFTYQPPVGVADAVDTFTYTLLDNDGQTDIAQIRFIIGQRIWFVAQSFPGSTNVGTSSNPFIGFSGTNVNGAGGLGDQDGPGDIIFLYTGTHTAAILLEANQTLWGQGDALVVDGINVVAAGTRPILLSPADGVTLASNNTLRGFNISNTSASGFDIAGTNFGSLIVSNIDMNGSGGALSLSNGTLADVTFGTISVTSAPLGIDLNNVAGLWTVTGATSINGIAPGSFGIRIQNSGTLSSHFNATSMINGPTGVLANNGGTLNFSGSGNTVTGTTGPAIDLTSTSLGAGATFISVSSSASPTTGVNLNTVTGSFTANGGNISNATGNAFDVNAGSSNITYAGTITNTTARSVDITNRTGGTITLSGNISDTGTGINVALNTGGTINFSGSTKTLNTGANAAVTLANNSGATLNFTGGGLDIDTTTGAGFNATGGAAAISVQGSGNSITSTTGTALNVANSTIGASGLTFQSISSNGGTNGIVLNSTGALAGLTVTGTGAADSGGTLLNSSGDAISLNQTGPVSISRMRLEDNLGNGIFGTSVNGLSLAHVRVIDNADNDAIDEAGIHLVNLLGTSSWTSIEVADSLEDNARILNSGSNHLTQLTISNSVFRDTSAASPGNNGLLIQADGSANMTADVSSTDFLRNRANGIQVINNGTGTVDVEIGGAGSDFTDNNIGINIAHNGPSPGRLFFDVSSGNFNSTLASPINLNLGGATAAGSVMEGNVLNTVIDNNDSLTGPGIRVTTNGGGTMTVLLENNQISEVANRGIEMIARDGSSTLNATLVRNNINLASALAADALHIAAGAISTDTVSVCADINGDNIVANRNSVFSAGINGMRVRQRFTGTSFTLEDYAGGPTDMTAVQNFLAARNVGGDTYVADFAGAGFGTIANCPMPAP